MSKKKPAKKKPENPNEVALRLACESIVGDLYAEVERVYGLRLAAFKEEHDATVRECGQIIERLMAVENRLAGCQKPEPTTWLGRLHRRKWFCLPWCRG